MKVLIRADATPTMGTGHVMRCLAVAEALADQGDQVVFAAADITPALEHRLRTADFPLTRLPGPANSVDDLRATLAIDADAVFLDGYHFDGDYRAGLRKGGVPIAVFDDLADRPALHADLVINAGLQAATLPYDHIAPGARLLLGPAFAPLRREIRQAARDVPLPLPERRSVLVSFGGSDPLRLTGPCVRALVSLLPLGLRITAIIGGSHPDAALLVQEGFGDRVDMHVDTPHMGSLMRQAGLAVSAAGGTTAELAALSVPSLLTVVAGNQVPSARELEARGLCDVFIAAGPQDGTAIARRAAALWTDVARRASMAAAFRGTLDGEGAVRIAKALRAL